MQYFDVCNGDADGLIARHQFRLSFPVASDVLTLITGAKRDIDLLSRVDVRSAVRDATDISVFDISYDRNAAQVRLLLDAGAGIRYFDHHRASQLQTHPRLDAHIDTSADVCTSLSVDRYLGGVHRQWAIAAAFGDNLTHVAEQLAASANLSNAQISLLRRLGECINYNAYGESIEDLHYPPGEIARRMMPFESPFEFARDENILPHLLAGYADDVQHAQAVPAHHESDHASVYVLPDQTWARRVSGTFANLLAHADPQRAHAVLSSAPHATYTVSIRAPLNCPHSADTIAIQFADGGGRAAAAGINHLAADEILRLIALLDKTYGAAKR
jgi:hypothetical protein